MSILKNIFTGLYIHPRFCYFGVGVIFVFAVSFFIPALFVPAQILFYVLVLFLFFDILILFNTDTGVKAERIVPEKMSNGDENEVRLILTNYYRFRIQADIVDEIPVEFQERDFLIQTKLAEQESIPLIYFLRPTFRGVISFGKIHV